MGIPQRIIFTGLQATPGDTHELIFKYQALKGGVHAYDFLMSWDQAVLTAGAIANGPTNELQNLLAQQCNATMSADGLGACTTATNVLAIECPDIMGDPPGITCGFPPYPNTTNSAIQCFEGIFGNRFVHVYGNQPVTWGELVFTGYTGSGDVYATYKLRWKSTSDKIKILLAGRSAQSCSTVGCCGYGAGCGSGGVSGGPYHFKLDLLDDHTLGSQDNQMQAALAPLAPTCDSVVISGPDSICPSLSGNIYTANYNGVCNNITHHWSITGAGAIIGASTGSSVSVTAGSSCNAQFFICDSITCDEGRVICCRIINVVDHISPVITCPNPPLAVECPNIPNFGSATATDNCNSILSITANDVVTPGTCPQEFLVTRTWTASDNCQNTSTCSRTISIQDNIPPTLSCPTVSNVECPNTLPAFGLASASDVCANNVTTIFSDATTPGTCPQEFSVTRTWTASDDCGNSSTCSRTISVTDNTPPGITCPAIVSPIECPTAPSFGNATAIDACDNNVIPVFSDNTTPLSCAQEFSVTRTWTATDDCGNSSTCSRTIFVEDNTAPVFAACPPGFDLGFDPPSILNCGNQAAPTASDNCGTPLVSCTEGTIDTLSFSGRSRTITWVATDECGNSATCSRTWTWTIDTTLHCIGISGPDTVNSNSANSIYTVNYSGICSNPVHSWSISGNGIIVGSSNGTSISVTATNTGQFTICDTVTCDEGQIICCLTVDVIAPLQCVDINGPNTIGPNSSAIYSVNFTGTCSNVTHHWSISGNGTIVGSIIDSSVNVTSGIFGPFTLFDTITCSEGQIICSAIINVLDSVTHWSSLNTGVIENLQRIQFQTNNLGFAGGFAPAFPPYTSSVLIETMDAGNNWNNVFSSAIDFITDFTFTMKRKGNAITSGSGILKFTVGNNSSDWTYGTSVPASNVSAFRFINNSVGFAGDNLGNVYKTTDGGSSWSNAIFVGAVSTLESFAFFNNNVGLVVGHDASVIAKTTDGGNTWNVVSLSYGLKDVYTIQGNAYAVGPNGIVVKSTDQGNTWSPLTVPVSTMDFNSVFCPANNTCYAVGDYGAIIKTNNGGITWQQQNSATIFNLNSIYCTSANTCYAAGDNGTILKTTTGGNRLYITNDGGTVGDFIFYPNPASDILNFIFEESATYTITISNALGQTLIQQRIFEKTSSINIARLPKGVYVISVSSEEGVYMKRFLKM